MSGAFSEWQPRYAEHNVATFPVTADKVPAVKGYLRVGMRGSEQLSIKFPDNDAFGFACRRNRITVLDVDTPDERVLADAMSRHGETPFIVRSGSGHYQGWYRHAGERRKVRPDPEKPIDILGDGFVVAPPSSARKGRYQIIAGTLDDLDRLPTMQSSPVAFSPEVFPTVGTNPDPAAENPTAISPHHAMKSPSEENGKTRTTRGRRNTLLWEFSMRALAAGCSGLEELMNLANDHNRTAFYEPLSAEEVLRVIASALDTDRKGNNWFSKGNRIVVAADEIDTLLHAQPDAFVLLQILRRHHWGAARFVVANEMAEGMPGGWTRKRFAAARKHLLRVGELVELRAASHFHGPAIYRLKGGQK